MPSKSIHLLALVGTISFLAAPPAHPQDAVRADAAGNLLSPLNLSGTKVSGTLSPYRLGNGTPSSSTVLRGDGTWAGLTPGGNTVASTGNLLMGDSAGNVAAIPSGADLYRVLKARLEDLQTVQNAPANLLPPGITDGAGFTTGTVNADGTITVPANGYVQWTIYGDAGNLPLYGYIVATSDQPAGALVMDRSDGYDRPSTDSTLAPGVYRSAFLSASYYQYTVRVDNTTGTPITIYFPVLAYQDTGLALLASFADYTPVISQPVADLNFTKFPASDPTGRYFAEKQSTLAADSVSGNNANAGTLDAPKVTLQQTATNGSVFGLYRGSTFRDSLPFSTLGTTHGIVAQDVALGSVKPLPIISALDPTTDLALFVDNGDGSCSYPWTPTDSTIDNGGYNNVYVVEVDGITSNTTPIAARRRMTDVTSQGAVAAAPGSVYILPPGTGAGQSGTAGQWKAILHPSDSMAPRGSRYSYESVSRFQPADWGSFDENAGDGAMSGLELVGGSSGYGCLTGTRSFAGDRLVFLHASTHNAVIGGGNLQRSVFYESGDLVNGAGPSIQLAWYAGTGTGLRWNTSHCLFYMNVGDRFPNGLISHTGNGSSYDRGDLSDCAFLGARWSNGSLQGKAVDYVNVATGTINRVYVRSTCEIFGVGMPLSSEVKNSVFQDVGYPRVGMYFHDNIVLAQSQQDPARNANYPVALQLQQNGANASNNILWAHGLSGYTQGASDQAIGIQFSAGVTSGTIQRNIIILDPASALGVTYLQLPGGAPTGVNIDYNLVINTSKGGVGVGGGNAGNKSSFAKYQAAYTTLDQHSLYLDLSADPRGLKAIFVDPLNGDFRWAQTEIARKCAAYCRANKVGPAAVTSRWPVVPTVDEAVRLLTDL